MGYIMDKLARLPSYFPFLFPFIKKVLVIVGLITWIPPGLFTLSVRYFGVEHNLTAYPETTPLPILNPYNTLFIPIATLNIIVLVCLFRNVATYYSAIWLVVLGIWSLLVNASMENHLNIYYFEYVRRFGLAVYSISYIWFAYDLVVMARRNGNAKKEGNEAPVEEEERNKMISRDKVDQKDGDQVMVVCL